MPGHMFPLRAREGGVLVRAGHTEATVDLCRLAGLYPAAGPLRDQEPRRHYGATARPEALRRSPRPQGHFHCPAHPLSHTARAMNTQRFEPSQCIKFYAALAEMMPA